MDVKALQARLAAHAVERNWDPFFSPRSVSMALAGEAGALLTVFQWLTEDQARRIAESRDLGVISDSIADVVLYALRLAETLDIEIEDAVHARAAEKYPVSARRFEGVEERDARTEAGGPKRPPHVGSSTSMPSARPEHRVDSDADRAATRAASARETAIRPTAPAPVRGPAATRPASRPDPQSRGRAEPASRDRVEPPTRARADPPVRERAEPPVRDRAIPAPQAAPPPRPDAPPRGERYANLDTNSVLDLMKTLNKRIDDSRSDDTILREIKDEMDTLRRNVYSSKSKPAWIAGGLERLRALLEEAAGHPVGDKISFRDYITQISRILEV